MILTVGCSFTQGCELPSAHKDAWPFVLSRMINTDVKNLGSGGSGNDYMFRTAVEETVKSKYDIVIVQWSEPSRTEVWNIEVNKPVSVSAHSAWNRRFSWIKEYYTFNYNDLFRHTAWFCSILALQEYFKSIDQKYIFVNLAGFNPDGHWKEYSGKLQHIWGKFDTQYFLGWPNEGLLEWQGDCPLAPGGHPLELGHQRIAEKIYEHIRYLGWVS